MRTLQDPAEAGAAMLAAERDRKLPQGPVERPKTVRIANVDDEPALFDLICADLRENAVKVAPIDEDKVIRLLHMATRRTGGICGVIDGPDGVPVALTLMVCDTWYWSKQYFISGVIHYVAPEHRRSHHIDDLLTFDRWTQQSFEELFGYRTYLLSSVLGLTRVREKVNLWRRKFNQVGALFLHPSPESTD